eukprot:5785280-Amphidinium_carterae.1
MGVACDFKPRVFCSVPVLVCFLYPGKLERHQKHSKESCHICLMLACSSNSRTLILNAHHTFAHTCQDLKYSGYFSRHSVGSSYFWLQETWLSLPDTNVCSHPFEQAEFVAWRKPEGKQNEGVARGILGQVTPFSFFLRLSEVWCNWRGASLQSESRSKWKLTDMQEKEDRPRLTQKFWEVCEQVMEAFHAKLAFASPMLLSST